MPRCTQCHDLGVTITSDLSSSQHINEITAKAHKRANCILRCFASRGVSLLVRAFTVYVRPICHMVALPEKQIEKAQRRFTKRLRGLRDVAYTDRLNCLGLPTLELRRLQLDLIFCYKIVFGLTSLTSSDYFQFSSNSTRGLTYNKTIYTAKLLYPKKFCLVEYCQCGTHSQLTQIFHTLNVTAFRRTVYSIDLAKFLHCSND